MATDYLYSALFPAESDARGKSRRLPVIRVMAPLWSFGFVVRMIEYADELPGGHGIDAEYARSMRLLYELGAPTRVGRLRKLHPPVLFQAEVDKFFLSGKKGHKFPKPVSEGKSLLAVETVEHRYNKLPPASSYPVRDGDRIERDWSTPLVLSTFGPPPLIRGGAGYQYLPAMQLLQGRIRFEPTRGYLPRVRKELGLDPPKDLDDAETIVLLPDGFCVAGTLRLPWQTASISTWFKATLRRFDNGDDEDRGGSIERVLRPWVDPALGQDEEPLRRRWDEALAELTDRLPAPGSGPHWLDLSANARLEAEDLFWPDDGPADSFLFKRRKDAGGALHIDHRALAAHLAYRPEGGAPLSSLAIEPESFRVHGTPSALTVTGSIEGEGRGVDATYAFHEGGETLSVVDQGSDKLELAVPLVETSEMLREATGLQRPGPSEALGLVWTFTPLDDGWLHWPLPNATLGSLNRLLPATDAIAPSGKKPRLPGALAFGNRAGQPGFCADERAWSLALTDADNAYVEVRLALAGPTYEISRAVIRLGGASVRFDGLIPLTAFRQTSTRLLPDHADRALGSLALGAVSPDLLRGIEGRMWKHSGKGNAAHAVRVAAEITGLQLTAGGLQLKTGSGSDGRPEPAIAGHVRVKTLIRAQHENGGTLSADLRPWVWLRHDRMPTVQQLPLALAGDERNLPSGSRELAPLRRVQAPASHEIIYSFPNALDMRRDHVSITIDQPYKRASHEEPWRDEIGMAVTTLPSVSLFPGLDPRPALDRIELDGNDASWAGIETGVEYEARHDLALRDEAYAHATLPAKQPEPETPGVGNDDARSNGNDDARRNGNDDARRNGNDDAGSDGVADDEAAGATGDLFAPRPDNGPEGPAVEEVPATVWRRRWQRLNRIAALAASEERALLRSYPSTGGREEIRLTGVLGERQHVANSVELSLQTAFEERQEDERDPDPGEHVPPRVEAIGALSVSSDFSLALRGLPSDEDLTGVAGRIDRNGVPVEIDYGTASVVRDQHRFVDQRGLSVGTAPVEVPDAAFKSYSLKEVEVLSAEPKRYLLSLGDAIRLQEDEKPGLSFWCSDVCMDEAGQLALPDDSEPVENSRAFPQDHRTAYRWALDHPCAADDLIPIEGFYFEPLRLVDASLNPDPEDRFPKCFSIEGRLRLRVSGGAERAIPRAGGTATLHLSRDDANESFTAWLEAENLSWPLADPERSAVTVPRLELASLPEAGKRCTGTLHFEIGGVAHSECVKVTRTADKIVVGATRSADGVERGTVRPTALSVEISKRGQSAALRPAVAEVGYRGHFGRGKAALKVDFTVSLLSGELALGAAEFWLTREVVVPLKAAEPAAAGAEEGPALFFDGKMLGLSWKGEHANAPILGGLSVQEGRGSLMGALRTLPRPKNDGEAGWLAPHFDVVDSLLDGRFALSTILLDEKAEGKKPTLAAKRLELALVPKQGSEASPKRASAEYWLTGVLALPNWFRWPRLTATDGASGWMSATIVANPAEELWHSVELHFSGQAVRAETLSSKDGIALAAEVRHRLQTVCNDEVASAPKQVLSWSAFQIVRLLPLAGFEKELSDDQRPSTVSASDLRRKSTHVLALHDADTARRLRAATFIYHPDAARHAAVTGPLAKAALDEIEGSKVENALIVDFSAHHMLGWEGHGWRHALVPVAGIAVLGPRGSEEGLLVGPKTARLFRCTPDQGELQMFVEERESFARASTLPPPSAEQARAAEQRLLEAATSAADSGTDVGSQLLLAPGGEKPRRHRAVFQSFALSPTRENGALELTALTLPGASMALFLSGLAQAADGRPLTAYALAQEGRLERLDFFPGKTGRRDDGRAAELTSDAFDLALQRFRDWLIRNLVPSPDRLRSTAPEPGPPRALAILSAPTRSGKRIAVLARQEQEGTLAQAERDLVVWARQTLRRLAPWARIASLQLVGEDGGTKTRKSLLLVGERVEMGRPRRAPVPIPPVAPERQRVLRSQVGALSPGVLRGYVPLSASADFLTSEETFAEGAEDEGPRLSATGAAMSWTLVGGDSAILAGGHEARDFWLLDRLRVAYRPYAAHEKSSGPHPALTFALPEGFDAALPRALLPAPPAPIAGEGAGLDEKSQAFAPGYVETTRLSPRAGVWATARLGLAQRTFAGGVRASATYASETPLHARMPRPPLLARNDRPRASSHEPGHLHLSPSPSAILHGPRRGRVGSDLSLSGLNREPRSAWAVTLELESPRNGLLDSEWEGKIVLREVAIHSPPDDADHMEKRLWRVDSAAISVDGQSYVPEALPGGEDSLGVSGLAGATFSGFALRNESGSEAKRLLAADLPNLPPATPLHFEMSVVHRDGDGAILIRRVAFGLLAAGAGLHLTEAAAYFRFDDPEYNDRLDGRAKFASKEDEKKHEFVLAADRPKIRVADRIELGLGLRLTEPGQTLIPFVNEAGVLMQDKTKIVLDIVRTRQSAVLKLGVAKPGTSVGLPYQLRGAHASRDFLGFSIDCTALAPLKGEPRDEEPILMPGDRFQLNLSRETGVDLVRLVFDVVEQPLLPANPSAFALLALRTGPPEKPAARVSVPLYASSPPATTIELVDPRDLVDGLVRRRAIYGWRCFVPLRDLDSAATTPHFALQKINAVGGSWLPRALRAEWRRLAAPSLLAKGPAKARTT